jgi:UDP-arabinose 4-epimerase
MRMQPTVLVVGGAGYIGSHTSKLLAASGMRPITFDNLSTGHERFVSWGPLVRGDILDADAVERACREWQVAACIHFAACAYVGESIVDPARYYRNNVAGTISLLEGLRRAGVRHIVFSSTCAVYGEHDPRPISEQASTNPVNPYGASKLMVERMLADYARAYGLAWTALRYFNACGADLDGELGELRDPETHLIPRAMMALQGYIDDFEVFGTDYPTPDGTAVRDYIHVADLAKAHHVALIALQMGGASGPVNLGVGTGYSVKQMLDKIAVITGRRLPAVSGPRRPGDPSILIADPRLAEQRLGFRPRHSELDTIVASAWAWHCKAHPQRVVGSRTDEQPQLRRA